MFGEGNLMSKFFGGLILVTLLGLSAGAVEPVATVFATGGGLKMFYDNRSYPQAVASEDSLHVVWRGQDGWPYLSVVDPKLPARVDSEMLLNQFRGSLEKEARYVKDHHYAPVIWADSKKNLHVLAGCHKTPGIHLVSRGSGDTRSWERGPTIAPSISYPQVHGGGDGETLIFYRHSGHLGHWAYRVSSGKGAEWSSDARVVIDMDATPQDSEHASYAGSYCTTRLSSDRRQLHIAFIWKVEEPVFNQRYGRVLDDHTQRYNLYYVRVDLASGAAFNIQDKPVELPVRKRTADESCLVWDTDERAASVGPAIALGRDGRPHLLITVSDETPHAGDFFHVRFDGGTWKRTQIAPALHPFNSARLQIEGDTLRAILIAGENEEISEVGMDEYGYGRRVELWRSEDAGESWEKETDVTPTTHQKFQSVQLVVDSEMKYRDDLFLFYGWNAPDDDGSAYMVRTRDR